ncbi:MAG: alanine racemase [Betaproteobacteria bacterium]|nr:alanine racemase [Betaproteobacteria bacterium]
MLEASAESSWIEIDGSALRANLAAFRGVLGQGDTNHGERKLGIVLKANAYGHGLLETLTVVHPLVDIIHLISPRDALLVRKYEESRQWPRRRLLVIGATSPEEFVQLAEEGVEVTLGDDNAVAAVAALQARGLRAQAHVHVETGLSREGFFPSEMRTKLAFLNAPECPFEVKGVLSHFANTEDVTEQQYALQQLKQFDAGVTSLSALLGKNSADFERHIAASAATLVLPQSQCDFVRVGISLYGLWPSTETRLSAKIVLPNLPKLQPVLSWRCRSQIVKKLAAGAYVGYGCTFRCERETRIAVLPIGYYDGYPRILSGRAHVLVNGHRAPVLGRVMMNHIVVDVTGVTGDEGQVVATLLGSDSGETVSAEMVAGWAQTIHYEIVTRIGSHLRRIVIDQ